jgi:recA bacterial DNA recombination protein
MSSAVVSTPAAQGRPFVFDADADPEVYAASSVHRRELYKVQSADQESPIARLQSTINHQPSKILPARVTPASQLEIRPAPEMVSSGIPAIDSLTGGLPRGCLTEVCGPASSGRTALLLAALAAATRRGEFCAVVDASDALDPQSVAAAGVDLERLLWVRCGEDSPQRERLPRRHPSTSLGAGSDVEKRSNQINQNSGDRVGRQVGDRVGDRVGPRNQKSPSENSLEQVLRATDLLLESGGFGLIALDLGDVPPQAARRIPLTTWFRFRRAIEYTSTILLAIEQRPIAGSCSSLLLQLGLADRSAAERRKNAAHGASRGLAAENKKAPEGRKKDCKSEQSVADPQNTEPAHARLLTGLNITVELIRSRLDRKPARSVSFETETAWAG